MAYSRHIGQFSPRSEKVVSNSKKVAFSRYGVSFHVKCGIEPLVSIQNAKIILIVEISEIFEFLFNCLLIKMSEKRNFNKNLNDKIFFWMKFRFIHGV